MENTKPSNKQLATKIAKTCCLFAVIISVLIGVLLGISSYRAQIEDYSNRAFGFTRMIADHIDADSLEHYLDTKEKDDYYNEIEAYIGDIRKYNNIDYIYVGQARDDELHYVWGSFINAADEDFVVGHVDKLSKEARKKVHFYDGNEQFLVYTMPGSGLYGAAGTPLKNSRGEVVGFVSADVDMNNIISYFIKSFVKLLIMTAIVTAFVSYLLYKRTKNQIVKPLLSVKSAVGEMIDHIEDEENIQIDCNTGDEIEELANAFTKMNADMKVYIEKIKDMTIERQKIQSDLEAAASIQRSALVHEFPCTDNYEIFAIMDPAKEVGGDFYDFFPLDDTHMVALVADVSGKGVPAAMLMVSARTFIRNAFLYGQPTEKVFENVNNRITEQSDDGFFITALGGVLDLTSGEFKFVNAGHLPPFIRRKNGNFEKRPVKAELVLGCFHGTEYHTDSIILEPGDRMFLYTDGVTEAMNPDKNEYGFDNLLESLNRHAAEDQHGFVEALAEDISIFAKDTPQNDDITMLCLDFKKRM